MQTKIAGLALEHPVMNGAGWGCKTVEEISELAQSACAAIVVGSITKEPRGGNLGEVYFWDLKGMFSLNSLGLPNRGISYYKEHLPEMIALAHAQGKSLIASVAGFSPMEFADLAAMASQAEADAVELNLGCPNVWKEGDQKPIFSYDPDLVEAVLMAVQETKDIRCRVGVKLSPLPPDILRSVVGKIRLFPIVSFVTATNTVPNSFALDNGESAIDPGNGLAGLAGPALKPIAMGVVKQLCDLLPEGIDIVAAGGVSCGQDVADYLAISPRVKAAQVVTAHVNRGTRIFEEVLSEFTELQAKSRAI